MLIIQASIYSDYKHQIQPIHVGNGILNGIKCVLYLNSSHRIDQVSWLNTRYDWRMINVSTKFDIV